MSLFETLRRPEHTGERRCWPCTAVNSAIVLGLAGVVGRRWRPAGAAVLAVGAAAIALRGYVVPYTPRFAPKLVEPLPFDFKNDVPESDSFATIPVDGEPDHAESTATDDASVGDGVREAGDDDGAKEPDADAADARESASLAADDPEGEELVGVLLAAGVLVDDGETLRPSDEFADEFERELATLRDSDDDELVAAVAEAAPFEADGYVDEGGDWVVVEGEGQAIHLTRPIAIAETAAVRAMADYDVPADQRPAAARPLRMFVTTCPVCGGHVEETTTAACCGGSHGVYGGVVYDVLACEDCEALVFEFGERDGVVG